MASARYVCMSCHGTHDAPGFCPHCSRGELLDTTSASDRELLADLHLEQEQHKRSVGDSILLFVLYLLINLGLSNVLQALLGWREDSAYLVSLVASMAVLIGVTLVWKRRNPGISL